MHEQRRRREPEIGFLEVTGWRAPPVISLMNSPIDRSIPVPSGFGPETLANSASGAASPT
jgi:hypothetical protein